MVRYYGHYSVRSRAERRRRASQGTSVIRSEKPAAASERRRRWVELIRLVFEVDPLRCDRCGGEMKVIYGAPNASPHVERFIRTLREEALDHFIFLGISRIRRVLGEYTRYYNGARPSQAINGIPEPYPEPTKPPRPAGKLPALPVLAGIQHDYRLAA